MPEAFTKRQIGGATYHGVDQFAGMLSSPTNASADALFGILLPQTGSYSKTGEVSDVRNGDGSMAGHVMYGQEETAEFTYQLQAATTTARDTSGIWTSVEVGSVVEFTTADVDPSHFNGFWMVTDVGDSHSNTEVTEFSLSLRRAYNVDYTAINA
jgi:hypothetical protein